MELLAGDVDRLQRRFLAEDLLFEGCWRAPFEVASSLSSVLIALSSGECAFPWAVTLCLSALLPLGSGGGFAELERLLVAQVSDAFAECRVEEPRPVPPRMLPGRRGCPPTFRWNRWVWAWVRSSERVATGGLVLIRIVRTVRGVGDGRFGTS